MEKHYTLLVSAMLAALAIHAAAPARWISGGSAAPEAPAPVLVRDFALESAPERAVLALAVAGWCEVRVNGKSASEDVLAPVTCQPDRRISSLELDVTRLLKPGANRIEVLLGNGWQNCFSRVGWGFSEAPWLSAPKINGDLRVDGRVLLVTDAAWRAYDSPVVFNALRNGEWYDARRETDSPKMRPASVEKFAPWGRITPEDAVPCRAVETFTPVRTITTPDGRTIYDFGANISGWCEIDVSGSAGAKVALDYDESLSPTNTLLGYIAAYLNRQGSETRPVQHDEYTLAGRSGGESWHPRFTYHGFRYVMATIEGNAKIDAIRARFVHSAFRTVGTLETSDPSFSALQAATMRSYLSNFVGIPTDCPHREKNGWTGDAQLAAETGLWNFDSVAGYRHFVRMMIDAQRPNGSVPCIVPCTPKFGLGWGTGPAWDNALFEIPWQVYRLRGDDALAREAYPAMKAYMEFIATKTDGDGLYEYGLGDWASVYRKSKVCVRLTDSAYVYQFNRRLAFWARRFGEPSFAAECDARADAMRVAFNKAFHKGDGLYDGGMGKLSWTALAAPLYFEGLCADGMAEKTARRLVEAVRANSHKADFGILGGKWVPRVLVAYGYVDDAWKLFTQPEWPGWMHWLKSGDGTLYEDWTCDTSHNHIMYGDLSAWAYELIVGIVPVEPGFRKVAFRPHFPSGVDSFSATYLSPYGEICASWRRDAQGKPVFTYSVPAGVEVVK